MIKNETNIDGYNNGRYRSSDIDDNTSCISTISGSSYYQTPQERYNSGWNHGIAQAILDYNDANGYDNWSPGTHTVYYYLGFHDGYRAEWYYINYPQQYQIPTQSEQTINNYISIYGNSNTVTSDNRQGDNQ